MAQGLALEGGLARRQGIEHGGQGEDVATRADFLPLPPPRRGLVGGHEGDRAAGTAGLFGIGMPQAGHAEVDQPRLPASSTRMLLGLMSRWIIPCQCA